MLSAQASPANAPNLLLALTLAGGCVCASHVPPSVDDVPNTSTARLLESCAAQGRDPMDSDLCQMAATNASRQQWQVLPCRHTLHLSLPTLTPGATHHHHSSTLHAQSRPSGAHIDRHICTTAHVHSDAPARLARGRTYLELIFTNFGHPGAHLGLLLKLIAMACGSCKAGDAICFRFAMARSCMRVACPRPGHFCTLLSEVCGMFDGCGCVCSVGKVYLCTCNALYDKRSEIATRVNVFSKNALEPTGPFFELKSGHDPAVDAPFIKCVLVLT